jgi:hypothetical protein
MWKPIHAQTVKARLRGRDIVAIADRWNEETGAVMIVRCSKRRFRRLEIALGAYSPANPEMFDAACAGPRLIRWPTMT